MPWHRLGGLEFHCRDLAIGLLRKGCEVTVVTTPGGLENLPSAGEQLRIVTVGGAASGDYSVRFFRKLNRTIEEVHKVHPLDVVHGQELAALFLRPPAGVPLVVTVHGTMFSETLLDRRARPHLTLAQLCGALWRGKTRVLLAPIFRRMLSRAGRLIVDSEFSFREVAQLDIGTKAKLRIVPLGLDAGRYPGGPARAASPVLRVAMLGRVQEVKGIGIVIQAAEQLRVRGVHVRFNIGGSGDYLNRAKKLIRDRGLNDIIVFHGKIEPADVPKFLASNDLFLFPDITQPAFGLVALEAMCYGLAVIGARNGAIPETVTSEVGWLYEAWNSSELAALVARLADAPEEVAAKGQEALQRWNRWSAGDMAEATIAVYGELLQQN